jgi:hypothetical protein
MEERERNPMPNLRVYDIVMEDGKKSLSDIILSMQSDYDWVDVFNELEKILVEPVESYSYEVVNE